MANLLKRWVESDKRELKRLGKIADKVESYADEFGALSDDELKAKTEEFKAQVIEVLRKSRAGHRFEVA